MREYREVGGWLLAAHEHPARLAACLPGGQPHPSAPGWTAAPDCEAARAALGALGYAEAPGAEETYHWPGPVRPMQHQRETVRFLLSHRRCLVLNDMGTGKTLSALWAAHQLLLSGRVRRLLVICPLSTIHFTWGMTIFRALHSEGVRYEALVAPAKSRQRKLMGSQHIDLLNHGHAAFRSIMDQVVGRYDLVIVDEVAKYRNATSSWKDFWRWIGYDVHKGMRIWGMTGTPTPQRPTDAWVLGRLVGSPDTPPTRRKAMELLEDKDPWSYRYTPRPGWREHVERMLQPSIRFKLSDCVDLPDSTTQQRHVELTKQQRLAYVGMQDNWVSEIAEGKEVTAMNSGIAAMRLVQICGGGGYVGGPSDVVELDCKPRLSECKDVLDASSGKAIIFVPYVGVLEIVHRELEKSGYSCAVVTGAVSAAKRAAVFRAFQEDPVPRVLVAVPQTMSHGLTLTAASTIVWWSPVYSNETYMQACARVDRIGKRYPCSIVQITSSPIEREMYRRLESKQSGQASLLAALTAEIGAG